jgi:hypothetical protein
VQALRTASAAKNESYRGCAILQMKKRKDRAASIHGRDRDAGETSHTAVDRTRLYMYLVR